MADPMFSIIVPVYRTEAWLPACVRSLLCQSFPDFELLLIEDGSPDGCGALCDGFAREDARVRVFHQKNAGVSAARNRGLEEARGRYILFADSDDRAEPELLAHLREAFAREPELPCAYGYVLREESGESCPCAAYPAGLHETEEFLEKAFTGEAGISLAVWQLAFPRERLGQLCFDRSLAYGEDALFFASLLKGCRQLQFDPAPLYHYMALRAGNTQGVKSLKRCEGIYRAWRSIAGVWEDSARLTPLLRRIGCDWCLNCLLQARAEAERPREKALSLELRQQTRTLRRTAGVPLKQKLRLSLLALLPGLAGRGRPK